MKKEWKEVAYRIGPVTHHCVVNKIKMGFVTQKITAKGEPVQYKFHCLLPGVSISMMEGTQPTIEAAKKRVEELIDLWFKKVLTTTE